MSRPIATVFGLVLSRMRYDLGRHIAAVAAIMALMATALLFQAISDGMASGLDEMVAREKPNHLTIARPGIFGQEPLSVQDLADLQALAGVVAVQGRAVQATGLLHGDGFRQVFAAGIDPAAERDLVVPGEPPEPPTDGITTVRFGAALETNYTLVQGRWIEALDEAVITWSLTDMWSVGSEVEFRTHDGNRTFRVVGVVLDDHPAGLTDGSGFPGGHIIVDRTVLGDDTYEGARIITTADYEAVAQVASLLRERWPEAWRDLKPQVEAFEKRHYDAVMTTQVLGAAGRFLALTGAGTMFALSLLLLVAERRSMGLFAAVGLGPRRTVAYACLKMTVVTLLGLVLGTFAGYAAMSVVPLPELGYAFTPSLSPLGAATAIGLTVAAAAMGTALAVWRVRRVDPIDALRLQE